MKLPILSLILLILTGCNASIVPSNEVRGLNFPSVVGTSLDRKDFKIPEDFNGDNVLLLIGYTQNAQFDIDRWILGVLQAEITVKLVEVPTIKGMVPQMIQSYIDNGMRSGIPKEDWGSVITVYEDANKIVKVLGNERPQSAYVVLLDPAGKIIWSTNRGYSATQVLELKKLLFPLK